MMTTEIVSACIRCGKLKVKGEWFNARRAPAHKPVYKHALCPGCRKLQEEKLDATPRCGSAGLCPDKKLRSGRWLCGSDADCEYKTGGVK